MKIKSVKQNVKSRRKITTTLLADQKFMEVWLQDLERELVEIDFQNHARRAEEKPIRMSQPIFYKMMIRFWKVALLIEKNRAL